MRRRWRALPLRARLSVGLVTLVAAALVVVGVLTAHFLRQFLTDRLDQQLAQSVNSVSHRPPGLGQQLAAGLSVGTVVLQTDVSGQLVGQPLLVVPEQATGGTVIFTSGDLHALAAVTDDGSQAVHLTNLGPYRFSALTDPRDQDRVVVGLPLRPVEQTVHRLELVEAIAFVAALAAMGGLGAWLIRRELRPLERVAATARRVSATPLSSGDVRLDERVPVEAEQTEVGQVGTAFNAMLNHVSSALAERTATEERLRRFVGDASHELRTPLASIRGYAELFRHARDAHPEDLAKAMSRVEAEAERMGGLVDDLLLLARLDQGRPLRREPVDVTMLAADAAADARVAAPDHPVSLDLPAEPLFVLGDEDRLRQVLANLVANTRVHTPPGTRVIVHAASVGDAVVLGVEDDGPGVPETLQPRVFERFTRADEARTRRSELGGTGLGLSIVAAVVGAHGGDVSMESRPGRTLVRVRLPAHADMPAAGVPVEAGP